jgi:hypothetical protein
MSEEKEIREVVREERRSVKTGKFKALPRNKQTEADLARIFENGTERELMKYLRENGLNDDEPRFALIVKLFREHAAKRW